MNKPIKKKREKEEEKKILNDYRPNKFKLLRNKIEEAKFYFYNY